MILYKSERAYPQTYIIRKPLKGALWSFAITFVFMMVYRPLDANDQKILGYEGAMATYCFLACLTFFAIIVLMKRIPFFSEKKDWLLVKELVIVFISLPIMSLVIFLAGLLIENGGNPNLYDSFKSTCLIGILPFVIFSLLNLSQLKAEDSIHSQYMERQTKSNPEAEKRINIVSKLKGENLSFSPEEFLYAESEGNYVTFFLVVDHKIKKKTIRNSISDIENQLSEIDHFQRVHRAFIVNLKKIEKGKGNALGYRLKLQGIENEVPVSRQNIKELNLHLKKISPDL